MLVWAVKILTDRHRRCPSQNNFRTLRARPVLVAASDLLRCRLSLPQAKAAFVCAQCETGDQLADTTLDFDELLECIARCGIDKYRGISQMTMGAKVRAMVANLLGERSETRKILAPGGVRSLILPHNAKA